MSRSNNDVQNLSKLKRTHEHFKINHLSKVLEKCINFVTNLYENTFDINVNEQAYVTLWEETSGLLVDCACFNYFGGGLDYEDPENDPRPFIPPA